MIAAWILYSLILGAFLALGALIADRAAGAARIPRRFTWIGSLALLVGLTALAPWRANAALGAFASATPADAEAISANIQIIPLTLSERVVAWVALPIRNTVDAIVAGVPVGVDRTIGIVWALGSLGALALVWLTLLRFDRQRRDWPHTNVHGKQVRVTGDRGPAVYGVFTPEIVIPSALLSCSDEDQRIVLAHEEEHRRARDPFVLALSATCVALLPWHPLAWWLASRLRLAVELDCDSRVLARGTSVRSYGEMLLRLAAIVPKRPSVAPTLGLLDSSTHLELRLLTMTTRTVRRTPVRVAAFLATVVSAIAIACNAEVPTAAQIRDADATTIARDLRLVPSNVVYRVDGEEVAAAEAEKIRAEDIQTIDIRRAPGGSQGASEIYIVTKNAPADAQGALHPTRLRETVAGQHAGTIRRAATPGQELRLKELERSPASAEQPLFLVDEVVTTSIKGLNPEDIATVEVIKGAAATERYGQAGGNGVISITMKKKR